MTNGIILGYTVPNTANDDLQVGDLVQRLDGYDNNYYTIKKINKLVQYPYYLKSRHNSELVNFHRKELVKCHYAFFDYEKYFSEGKMKLLGLILLDDLNHIKAKRANELEIGWSQLD